MGELRELTASEMIGSSGGQRHCPERGGGLNLLDGVAATAGVLVDCLGPFGILFCPAQLQSSLQMYMLLASSTGGFPSPFLLGRM